MAIFFPCSIVGYRRFNDVCDVGVDIGVHWLVVDGDAPFDSDDESFPSRLWFRIVDGEWILVNR